MIQVQVDMKLILFYRTLNVLLAIPQLMLMIQFKEIKVLSTFLLQMQGILMNIDDWSWCEVYLHIIQFTVPGFIAMNYYLAVMV